MLVERFAENPLITPADVPPSRDDYEVVGAFNAGAVVYNNKTLLLLRVAERPANKSNDEQVAPILDPETGRINLLRVKNDDPDLEIPDHRIFYYKKEMYLTSISHLRIALSDDGINFEIDPAPAVFPETDYETYGLEDPRITQIGELFYISYKVVSQYGIATGLLTTTDDALRADVERYCELLNQKERTAEDEAETDHLRKRLNTTLGSPETELERRVATAVHEVLRRPPATDDLPKEALDYEIKRQLRDFPRIDT